MNSKDAKYLEEIMGAFSSQTRIPVIANGKINIAVNLSIYPASSIKKFVNLFY